MAVRVASRKSSKKAKAGKVEVKTEPSSSNDVPSTSNGVPSTSANVPSTSGTEIKAENEVKEESNTGSSQATKKEIDTIPLSLPKFNPNKQARGHFGSSKRAHPTQLVEDPSYKKTKKNYSIAKDPQSSEVYKSIFTSHKTDQEQKRAHWVTYNPFYN